MKHLKEFITIERVAYWVLILILIACCISLDTDNKNLYERWLTEREDRNFYYNVHLHQGQRIDELLSWLEDSIQRRKQLLETGVGY
jgi:hypothetical protein